MWWLERGYWHIPLPAMWDGAKSTLTASSRLEWPINVIDRQQLKREWLPNRLKFLFQKLIEFFSRVVSDRTGSRLQQWVQMTPQILRAAACSHWLQRSSDRWSDSGIVELQLKLFTPSAVLFVRSGWPVQFLQLACLLSGNGVFDSCTRVQIDDDWMC